MHGCYLGIFGDGEDDHDCGLGYAVEGLGLGLGFIVFGVMLGRDDDGLGYLE